MPFFLACCNCPCDFFRSPAEIKCHQEYSASFPSKRLEGRTGILAPGLSPAFFIHLGARPPARLFIAFLRSVEDNTMQHPGSSMELQTYPGSGCMGGMKGEIHDPPGTLVFFCGILLVSVTGKKCFSALQPAQIIFFVPRCAAAEFLFCATVMFESVRRHHRGVPDPIPFCAESLSRASPRRIQFFLPRPLQNKIWLCRGMSNRTTSMGGAISRCSRGGEKHKQYLFCVSFFDFGKTWLFS